MLFPPEMEFSDYCSVLLGSPLEEIEYLNQAGTFLRLLFDRSLTFSVSEAYKFVHLCCVVHANARLYCNGERMSSQLVFAG